MSNPKVDLMDAISMLAREKDIDEEIWWPPLKTR